MALSAALRVTPTTQGDHISTSPSLSTHSAATVLNKRGHGNKKCLSAIINKTKD